MNVFGGPCRQAGSNPKPCPRARGAAGPAGGGRTWASSANARSVSKASSSAVTMAHQLLFALTPARRFEAYTASALSRSPSWEKPSSTTA